MAEVDRIHYIHDACIIIDLHSVGLLSLWLSNSTCVLTDLVHRELLKESNTNLSVVEAIGVALSQRSITLRFLSEEELTKIIDLYTRQRKLSQEDISCCVAAKADGVGVLTGDKRLRSLCKRENVTVNGTLYVLDLLVARGKISNVSAKTKLEGLVAAGCRLPADEVAKRLRSWSS